MPPTGIDDYFAKEPEFNSGDVEAKKRIWRHAKRLYDTMTEPQRGRTTLGVAEVERSDGSRETWIATAGRESYVKPKFRQGADRVIDNLHPDGERGNHLNDAEGKILREMAKEGVTTKALGATREMCLVCQDAAEQYGVLDTVVTPKKPRE